jgi:chromosome segregation ATPase
MKILQKTIGTLSIIALAGLAFPPAGFAQTDREDRDNNARQEREDQKEEREKRIQTLRQKADELRNRFLHATSTPEIETQETKNITLDRKSLTEKMQEFKQAKATAQEQPETLENQKAVLLRAIDSLLEHTKLLQEKTNRFSIIDSGLKASIQAEIEADIAQLEDFRLKVQQAATQEELRRLAQTIKEHRANITQTKVRKLMLLAHSGVFEYHVIEQALQRADAIAERFGEFETEDKDISELEELLKEANKLIEDASGDLNELKQLIIERDIDGDLMPDIQASFNDIKSKIGDSYSLFRQIAQEAAEL